MAKEYDEAYYPPDGEYDATVVSADKKESRKGDGHYTQVRVKLDERAGNCSETQANLSLGPFNSDASRRFLQGQYDTLAGKQVRLDTLDPSTLVGNRVKLRVQKNLGSDGKTYHNIYFNENLGKAEESKPEEEGDGQRAVDLLADRFDATERDTQ